jgi:hypothetical protein
MLRRKPLQRADARKRFVLPERPKSDIGQLQTAEVERMRAARAVSARALVR